MEKNLDGNVKFKYFSKFSDECIENIFSLANIFAFEELEAKCRTFLIEHSEKSAFFKYRLADKFDLIILRVIFI